MSTNTPHPLWQLFPSIQQIRQMLEQSLPGDTVEAVRMSATGVQQQASLALATLQDQLRSFIQTDDAAKAQAAAQAAAVANAFPPQNGMPFALPGSTSGLPGTVPPIGGGSSAQSSLSERQQLAREIYISQCATTHATATPARALELADAFFTGVAEREKQLRRGGF